MHLPRTSHPRCRLLAVAQSLLADVQELERSKGAFTKLLKKFGYKPPPPPVPKSLSRSASPLPSADQPVVPPLNLAPAGQPEPVAEKPGSAKAKRRVQVPPPAPGADTGTARVVCASDWKRSTSQFQLPQYDKVNLEGVLNQTWCLRAWVHGTAGWPHTCLHACTYAPACNHVHTCRHMQCGLH